MEPKATSPLSFPLLNPVLPHRASILFSTMSCIVGRPRDPALDPCLSIGCLQVEGGPELQVAWVAWAEMIEVPVASNPTCFNVLGNPSIPFPKGPGSFALEGLYYQSNQQKVSMLVSP